MCLHRIEFSAILKPTNTFWSFLSNSSKTLLPTPADLHTDTTYTYTKSADSDRRIWSLHLHSQKNPESTSFLTAVHSLKTKHLLRSGLWGQNSRCFFDPIEPLNPFPLGFNNAACFYFTSPSTQRLSDPNVFCSYSLTLSVVIRSTFWIPQYHTSAPTLHSYSCKSFTTT